MNVDGIIDKSLDLLEKERKNSVGTLKKRIIGIVGLLIIVFYFTILYPLLPPVLLILDGIVTIGLIIYLMISNSKKFTRTYKDSFISPLMKNIFPELEYDAKGFVSEDLFDSSNLYRSFNMYQGDDYFSGTINGTSIQFSELVVEHKSSNSGSDSSSSDTTTIFKGMFAAIQLENTMISSKML